MSATGDIDLKTLWNVISFIPRIIKITENIGFSKWFGSSANTGFSGGMLHVHVYVSGATVWKFLLSPPSKKIY